MDKPVLFFLHHGFKLTLALLLLKMIHFLWNHRWNLRQFIYFNEMEIEGASTPFRRKFRELQNTQTFTVVSLLLITAIIHVVVFFKK